MAELQAARAQVARQTLTRDEMSDHPSDIDDVRDFWNRAAEDWRIQVGDEGDANRRMNSDPVVWEMLGDVRGRSVLDAGCGTGYLTRQLHERDAHAIGVDISEEMIRIARAAYPGVDFRVDSASELRTIEDGSVDLIASNYVLMDTPDLGGTMRACHRVLKPGGAAVAVFSHPCFPQGRAERPIDHEHLTYTWDFSYFEQQRCVDPPWAHFTSDFIGFHRPLSAYWKAFRAAGFAVEDFEEPRSPPERYALAPSPRKLANSRTRPYSVAFKLRKRGS